MNLSLGEALAKAGIKGTKTLAQIENEIDREAERRMNTNRPVQSKAGARPTGAPPKGTDLLTRLWKGDRSKKFMLHVLHTFIPLNKVGFVAGWTEDQEKKCCMCRHDVTSKNEALTSAADPVKEIIKTAKPDSETIPQETAFIAVGVPGSRTVFCHKCWMEFVKWVSTSVDPDIQKLRQKGEPKK